MSLSVKKEPTGTEISPEGENTLIGKEDIDPENNKEDADVKSRNIDTEDAAQNPEENAEQKETGDGDGQEEETMEDDKEQKTEEQEALNVDLSRMKTLYQFRSRPTLPYLLTEYGMEDAGAPPIKQKEKPKKKRKSRGFGDDSGRDKEKEKQIEERQLQVLEDMKKLRDYYYDEYTSLLQNRVEQQRHDIRQYSRMQQERIAREEETAEFGLPVGELMRQESHRVKRRLQRNTFVSDESFMEDIPKTDLFYITQLKDQLIKEGTLKSQTDFDIFWERIQQPDIFYMYFKVPKSDDPNPREDFNDNASSRGASTWKGSTSTLKGSVGRRELSPPHAGGQGPKSGGPRALSRIAESRESSRPGTRVGHHWAITQQFPSQHRERRRSSFTGLKPPVTQQKSTYLQDLEKRFPKLEMPKLHCFTMSLGPKAPDPEEVRHEINLRELEKNRKKYTYKLNKMHQLAMANAAAASRILELHDDIEFIINGAPLKDLISDQHFYSGLPPPVLSREAGPTTSSPVPDQDSSQQYVLPSVLEHEERDVSAIHSRRSTKKTDSGKSRGSRKSSTPKSIEEVPVTPAPIPLSINEVVDNTRVMEAKCLSTLWTNYLKDVPPVKT